MNFIDRIWRSNFSIKLRHWEYWPFGILQFPVFFYYFWLSFRSKSFFFFSASNPGIEMGGLLGESKFNVLNKIPSTFKAKTIFIIGGSVLADVIAKIKEAGLFYPVIFKPDLGERGYRVKRIYSHEQADDYISTFRFDFLVQELIEMPLEFGVFYKCIPGQEKGFVFSVVGKEMLSVAGNGKDTLQELILKNDRAKLQWKMLSKHYAQTLHTIIGNKKEVVLNSIGNHCLGTKFLNANELINDKLHETFTTISKQIEGFYYGRYDLRCASVSDLYEGNIKIMELNGCGAEPAHIYHPGYSFWKAMGEVLGHWKNIFIIARENRRRGIDFLTFREVRFYYRKFKAAVLP
jgi:hypothetical protein